MVASRVLLLFLLRRSWWPALLLLCLLFLRSRPCGRASRAAVVAHMIHCRGVVDHRRVVRVVNVGNIHVVYGLIVIKSLAAPISSLIADARIPKAINHATVEADCWPPKTDLPYVAAAIPRPVAWGPHQIWFRRLHPGPWHPVIAIRTVRPVARGPDISIIGTNRLVVDRENRRSDSNGHGNLCA